MLAPEPLIRLAAFAGVFAAMALWELAAPWRAPDRAMRWVSNLALGALNTLLLRVAFPVAAVGAALVAEARGWGLFALMGAPPVLAALGAILILDLVVYAQHWALHRVPALWRIHRVHHADTALDVTTALRFHPIEIALSMLVKMAAVVALGAPPEAVVAFEVLLNATAMFNHANVRLPPLAERMLRWIVVTPGMHRVHHSTAPDETNSNYGFNLPWWDRLFRTYRSAPQAGDGIVIGLERFREPRERRLDRVLMQPLL